MQYQSSLSESTAKSDCHQSSYHWTDQPTGSAARAAGHDRVRPAPLITNGDSLPFIRLLFAFVLAVRFSMSCRGLFEGPETLPGG